MTGSVVGWAMVVLRGSDEPAYTQGELPVQESARGADGAVSR